jgi:lysophospholipase L1-like esterase
MPYWTKVPLMFCICLMGLMTGGGWIIDETSASGISPEEKSQIQWIDFPDARFDVRGLAWFDENNPKLWRLPKSAKADVRAPVWKQAVCPSGGRIRFNSNTSRLLIRVSVQELVSTTNSAIGLRGLDVYVDGVYWHSVCMNKTGESELKFFEGVERFGKEITIYLPVRQEIEVLAIGVDDDASISLAPAFAMKEPIVFYGSSIVQGSGVCRPGMTYPAIVARQLNVDYINLGFGGNGIGEPEVVDLVKSLDASCYVIDNGKSFQRAKPDPDQAYERMLAAIRNTHKETPLICMTPIYSTREIFSKDMREASIMLRKVMSRAAMERIKAGDRRIILVDGMELIGADDTDVFQEGLHPTDLGYQLIADRLHDTLKNAIFR